MSDDKKYENLFDDTSMGTGEKVGLTGIITGVICGGLFLIGSGAGLVIDELAVPANDDIRAGQEIALQQYDRMFNVLAEQRKVLDEKNMEFSSLAAIDHTPDMLQDVVGLSAEEQEIYGDVNLAKEEIGKAEEQLHSLAEKFAYSAVVDERLSEANVRDLFNRFESDVGSIKTLTGMGTPDYADLDQSRATVKDEIKSTDTTEDKAWAITRDSNSINGDLATDISGKLGAGIGLIYILFLLGGEYARSNRWRRRGGQKFNH